MASDCLKCSENVFVTESQYNKLKSKLPKVFNINEYEISIVDGSFSSYNMCFKLKNNYSSYFLKIMKLSEKGFDKALDSYKTMNICKIPIPRLIKYGQIEKNKLYYMLYEFVEGKELAEVIINDDFNEGVKLGLNIANNLNELKKCKSNKFNVISIKDIYKDIIQNIEYIYTNDIDNDCIIWSKNELINHVNKYIESFSNEPINVIHGDIKLENILLTKKTKTVFVDIENLFNSYDCINFFYNIHKRFFEEDDLFCRGFVNGYFKYMNHGVIPKRIQNQIKLLLLDYYIRTVKRIMCKNSTIQKISLITNSLKKYIEEEKEIEWLK